MKPICTLLFILFALSLNAQVYHDITDVGANVTAITARGSQGAGQPGKAFDNDHSFVNNSIWYDNYNPSAAAPSWLKVQFSGAQIITAYSITTSHDVRNFDPRDWALEGSNNNTTWTALDTRTNISFNISGETRFYSFANSTSYTYYRLRVDETVGVSTTGVRVGEMQLIDNLVITGYVFKDNGDAAYGKGAQDTAFASVSVSIVDRNNNNLVTKQTDASGYYSFSSSDLITVIGDFAIIVTPPSNYIYVSELPIMFRSGISLPVNYYNPPCGSIVFACYKNAENNDVLTNRFLFGAGTYNISSLDFGLKRAVPSKLAAATGYAYSNPMTNLITAATNGTFGTWNPNLPVEHPVRPGFTDGAHTELYYTLGGVSNYVFNGTTNAPSGGSLYPEGDYNTTSFFGVIQDIIAGSSGSYQGSLVNDNTGGWIRTYGATTADSYDMFIAVNGSPSGTTPFFTQTNLSLWANEEYMISLNAKGANAYVQTQNGLAVNVPEIVLEVYDNSNNLIYSANKVFNYSTNTAEDLPYAVWDQVNGVFTATNNGPFNIKIRASTTAAAGNDAYIDNISLFHVRKVDYGDAPSSFGTATAMHLIYNSIMLGTISADSNKTVNTSANADGDDNQGSDDEDGVSLFLPLTASTTNYSVDVQATNNYGVNGTLCGWIDFDGNGVFDASEGSCVAVNNGFSGSVTLNWTTSNPVTSTYARFRITTDVMTASNASGRMENGEVEDYRVDNISLPITLLEFNAQPTEQNTVAVTWKTASEWNSDYFTVLRSPDGNNWEEVTRLDAAGFSTQLLSYEATDEAPYTGTSYYRLRETNTYGEQTYSVIKMISISEPSSFTLTVLGNVVHGELHFAMEGNYSTAEMKIIDMIGNQRITSVFNANNSGVLNLRDLPAGTYLLAVKTDSGFYATEKFIVY